PTRSAAPVAARRARRRCRTSARRPARPCIAASPVASPSTGSRPTEQERDNKAPGAGMAMSTPLAMSAPRFHSLKIREVSPETADSVSVAFEVPPALREDYRFVQGQFLTLRGTIDGEELRRAYSVCVGTGDYARDGELRVAIKRVSGGRFSNWANDQLAAGATIDVMTPDGRFFVPLDPARARHSLGIAGGSGITPMLSLVETTLASEPESRFTLVYGNRDCASIMFLERIEAIKNRHMTRFA